MLRQKDLNPFLATGARDQMPRAAIGSSRRNQPPRNVLITGGAGFIGSHLVDRLLAEGHTVVVVDNFDPTYDPRLKELNVAAHASEARYALIRSDILASSTRDRLKSEAERIGGFDAIVHLAAKAGVRRSIEDPIGYQRVNVDGTQRMLDFAKEHGIGQFVFASSSSVYGVNPRVPWREDDAELMPISPYACTKMTGEALGREYSQLYNIRFVGLRFFTVYGPRQRSDLAINTFVRLILGNEPISLYGDGASRRDYTYVEDVVGGIVKALEYDASDYEVVNLGSGQPVTLLQMVREIEQALSRTAVTRRLPEQPGDVVQTFACREKAGRLLDFVPSTPFPRGIRKFVTWYLDTVDRFGCMPDEAICRAAP